MGKQTHRIKKQRIDLVVGDRREVELLQEEVSRIFSQELLPELERIFDEIAPEDELIRLETLELDLGKVRRSYLAKDLKEQVISQLPEILREKIQFAEFEKTEVVERISLQSAGEEALLEWLSSGTLSWSHAQKSKEDWTEVLKNALETGSEGFVREFKEALKDERVARRVAWQFPELPQLLHRVFRETGLKIAFLQDQVLELMQIWPINALPLAESKQKFTPALLRKLAAIPLESQVLPQEQLYEILLESLQISPSINLSTLSARLEHFFYTYPETAKADFDQLESAHRAWMSGNPELALNVQTLVSEWEKTLKPVEETSPKSEQKDKTKEESEEEENLKSFREVADPEEIGQGEAKMADNQTEEGEEEEISKDQKAGQKEKSADYQLEKLEQEHPEAFTDLKSAEKSSKQTAEQHPESESRQDERPAYEDDPFTYSFEPEEDAQNLQNLQESQIPSSEEEARRKLESASQIQEQAGSSEPEGEESPENEVKDDRPVLKDDPFRFHFEPEETIETSSEAEVSGDFAEKHKPKTEAGEEQKDKEKSSIFPDQAAFQEGDSGKTTKVNPSGDEFSEKQKMESGSETTKTALPETPPTDWEISAEKWAEMSEKERLEFVQNRERQKRLEKYDRKIELPPELNLPETPAKKDYLSIPYRKAPEEIYVQNAGLVITAPYLNTFFGSLGLVEEKEFVSEEARFRAIQLLQYIATGQEGPFTEPELSLNKLLCGLAFEDPVPLEVEFTKEEKEGADGLLEAIIQHWSALGSTSPLGLRGTFFVREGRIRKVENGWKMQVENKTFDILLERIPWGFSTIRFPWNDYFIFTEWL